MSVLRGRVEAIQRTQVALMRPLLFYPPSAADSLASVATHRGSKTAFHALVIFLVQKNVGVLRQVPPPGTSHNSTLVNLFFVVLWFLGPSVRIPVHSCSANDTCGTPTASSPACGAVGAGLGAASTALEGGCEFDLTPPEPVRPAAGAAAGVSPCNGRLAAAVVSTTPLPVGAAPVTPELEQRTQAGASGRAVAELTAIVTTRNGAVDGPRRNGSKKGCRGGSKELDGGSDNGGRSRGGTPQSCKRRPATSTFWSFPAWDFFLHDDAGSEAYLGLNRVGGILSEAAKNQPEDSEPLSVNASGVAAVLKSSGTEPACTTTQHSRCRAASPPFSDCADVGQHTSLQVDRWPSCQWVPVLACCAICCCSRQ